MNESRVFFIDVIKLFPEEVECYIQAPSLENKIVLDLLQETKSNYSKSIKLTAENRHVLLRQIIENPITDYFQHVQIRFGQKILFEGYDGVEYGVVSKEITLSHNFFEQYVNSGICSISEDW